MGGSFDPPHEGHLRISRAALTRFRLDAVWWVVSPGNPLKPRGPAPMERRLAAAREVAAPERRIVVTDIEARLGTRYTAETLRRLDRFYPQVRFVWLMGADNLAQLHRWQDWREIMERVPVGVLARPGSRAPARLGRAATRYREAMLPERAAHLLARSDPPAWCFLNLPMSGLSSTALRRAGRWAGRGG